ncbi:hypothetical protein B0F90DRAFT_1807830 [Multifurca ochricompacta]|uniref:RRN7-type domain-containing protein n=1 Tax=Multifurca ochricompacta TaxID=376703 RepID=A0AAD4QSK4_9AGAM|nr:hypothetical protein B0F90DRAFT_1807830 [Multifurca ochricompacta]
MAPRRKCTVCGSLQWHKEPATGLVVCKEGHVLQNYLNETHELHEVGPFHVRKRALKAPQERRGRSTNAYPELYYHGSRAQYLYFQCLQLLLRKQVATLIRLWGLPTEFEIICRDLWALHLCLLPSPPPPEPVLHNQATQGDAGDNGPTLGDSKRLSRGFTTTEGDKAIGAQGRKASLWQSGGSSSESESNSKSEDDSEMDELLGILSQSSSSEDDEDDDTGQPRPKPEGSERKSNMFGKWGPASNIAVLVVACWTLRLPIIYLDLIRLIESYDLPYLEPLHHLPGNMARHLTKQSVQVLSPMHAPTTLALHDLSARLARKLQGSYKIQTPELNAAPVLWRVVRALGGTPVLYNLSKTMAHVLSLPLALHHTLAPCPAQLKDGDDDDDDDTDTDTDIESHKYDDIPPELALVASVTIVLKMVYGLDGRVRVPKNSADPAWALPQIEDYLMIVKEVKEAYEKSKQVLFSASSEMSVLELDEFMLNEYLDLCQKGLLKPERFRSTGKGKGKERERNRSDLEDFFPFPSLKEDVDWNRSLTTAGFSRRRLKAAGVTELDPDLDLETGEAYAIYRPRDILGTLPEDCQLLISYGAKWVGVDEDLLLKVIERYEWRLARR